MEAIAHSWVIIMLAVLALVLTAGKVWASSSSSFYWQMMCWCSLFLFGDATKMSLTSGMVLVSSLAVGDSLLLFCFATLICLVELLMGLLGFSASFLL